MDLWHAREVHRNRAVSLDEPRRIPIPERCLHILPLQDARLLCVCVCVCVSNCMCVMYGEGGGRESGRKGGANVDVDDLADFTACYFWHRSPDPPSSSPRKAVCVRVCVCVCVSERQRDRRSERERARERAREREREGKYTCMYVCTHLVRKAPASNRRL